MAVEAHISILLSETNEVRDSILDIGSWDHVQYALDKIASTARQAGACKVVMAHNHPGWFNSTPSDQDVESAAATCLYLKPRGIEVVDVLVVCRGGGQPELKSVFNTLRFKQMTREY